MQCRYMWKWGLCALRHGIQISMEAILACHPARSTDWLEWLAKSCELWHIGTGLITCLLSIISCTFPSYVLDTCRLRSIRDCLGAFTAKLFPQLAHDVRFDVRCRIFLFSSFLFLLAPHRRGSTQQDSTCHWMTPGCHGKPAMVEMLSHTTEMVVTDGWWHGNKLRVAGLEVRNRGAFIQCKQNLTN